MVNLDDVDVPEDNGLVDPGEHQVWEEMKMREVHPPGAGRAPSGAAAATAATAVASTCARTCRLEKKRAWAVAMNGRWRRWARGDGGEAGTWRRWRGEARPGGPASAAASARNGR
jgi:hypothetical protein